MMLPETLNRKLPETVADVEEYARNKKDKKKVNKSSLRRTIQFLNERWIEKRDGGVFRAIEQGLLQSNLRFGSAISLFYSPILNFKR